MTEKKGGGAPNYHQKISREEAGSSWTHFFRDAGNGDHLRNVEYYLQAVVPWGEKHGNGPPLKAVVFLNMFLRTFS